MPDMIHFKKWSLIRGHVRVTINLEAYGERLKDAQWWLGNQVLQGCRALMPLRTGSLQDRSYVEDGGRRVVFPGPYARYLYMDKVMVDPVTGSAWVKEGVKKVVTSKRLTYSNSEAVDHWFDEAKARNLPYWVNGVENFIKRGYP